MTSHSLYQLSSTRAPGALVLNRMYVGVVFASEVVLKFLRPDREYGRHTGHDDLLREAVDRQVSEDPPPGWRPVSGQSN